MRKPKILLYDIETSPLEVLVWDPYNISKVAAIEKHRELLSCAYKWADSPKIYYASRQHDKTDEKLTKFISSLLEQADISVAHNGDGFDRKVIKARMLFWKQNPLKINSSVDTCKAARAYFGFSSNSLGDLCEHLGIGKKLAHPGISMWQGCRNGVKAAWELIKAYNKHDVRLLAGLYERMEVWIEDHPNTNLLMNPFNREVGTCPRCGSNKAVKHGLRATAQMVKQRWLCKPCSKHFLTRFVPPSKEDRASKKLPGVAVALGE
jgi:ssDNA-binding Zn-finger/Zn-ribbon topoisomerase 1